MAHQEEAEFLRNIRFVLLDLSRRLQQDVSEDVADYAFYRIQQLLRVLSRLAFANNAVYDSVRENLDEVRNILLRVEQMWVPTFHQLSTSQPGTSGRPRFEIPKEQLEYFVEHEITIPDIAQALGVSVSTVKRRLRDHGISIADRRSTIADCDLDNQVRDIQRLFPNAGYRRTHSQLSLRGFIVPQLRVRESMQRIDPEGVAKRWLGLTPRAVYCVSGPLALWHIDGNHKLIRLV